MRSKGRFTHLLLLCFLSFLFTHLTRAEDDFSQQTPQVIFMELVLDASLHSSVTGDDAIAKLPPSQRMKNAAEEIARAYEEALPFIQKIRVQDTIPIETADTPNGTKKHKRQLSLTSLEPAEKEQLEALVVKALNFFTIAIRANLIETLSLQGIHAQPNPQPRYLWVVRKGAVGVTVASGMFGNQILQRLFPKMKPRLRECAAALLPGGVRLVTNRLTSRLEKYAEKRVQNFMDRFLLAPTFVIFLTSLADNGLVLPDKVRYSVVESLSRRTIFPMKKG